MADENALTLAQILRLATTGTAFGDNEGPPAARPGPKKPPPRGVADQLSQAASAGQGAERILPFPLPSLPGQGLDLATMMRAGEAPAPQRGTGKGSLEETERPARLPGERATPPQGTALVGARTPWHHSVPVEETGNPFDNSLAASQSYQYVGSLEMGDQNYVVQPDGTRRLLDQQSEVVDRRTGGVYQRRDMPPNPEAAQYASRPGIVGKALSAIGVPDYSGDRARTSWGDAAENTARGFSLANVLRGGITAADRMTTETAAGRQDPLAAQQGAEIAGSIAATAAPTALAGGVPRNAVTTFIGDVGAGAMKRTGEPVPSQVLQRAQDRDAQGVRYDQIRNETNRLIVENDPRLRGVERGRDQQWRVELSDHDARLRRMPQSGETLPLSEILEHPGGIFRAYPELNQFEFEFRPNGGKLPPGSAAMIMSQPGKRGRIWVSDNTPPEQLLDVILHEVTHAGQRMEGHAPSLHPRSPDTPVIEHGPYYAPGVAERMPGALAAAETGGAVELGRLEALGRREGYYRSAGESEARIVPLRRTYTPEQGRAEPPRQTALERDVPYSEQIGYGAGPRERLQDPDAPDFGRADADRLMREIQTLERNLKNNGATPERIAQAIEERLARSGVQAEKIDPQDITNGTGWWNIDRVMETERGRVNWSGKPLSEEERGILQRGVTGGLPWAEIAAQITAASGRPMTEQSARHTSNTQGFRRNAPGERGSRLTPDEQAALRQAVQEGLSWEQAADRIFAVSGRNVSWNAARMAASRMRLAGLLQSGVPVGGVSEDKSEHWSVRQPRNDQGQFSGPPGQQRNMSPASTSGLARLLRYGR